MSALLVRDITRCRIVTIRHGSTVEHIITRAGW